MGFRITSWNVNGIRNPFGYQPWRENRTFAAMFDILESDIVVMQETKIQRKDLRDDMVLVPGWDVYFSLPRYKKGYSGVAIYTRNSKCSPIRAEEGITGCLCPPNSSTSFRDLPEDRQIGGYPRPGQLSGLVDEAQLDSEGRCMILEFPAFVLVGTYSPANTQEARDEFRIGYLEALDVRVRNLVAMGKRVVLTGDLNVIRSALDTANLAERLRKEGITVEDFFSSTSRRLFNHLVFDGKIFGDRDEGREQPVLWDLGRLFHPTREGMFTCWDTKKNCRPGNFGSRIDYVLCSNNMRSWFIDSNIQEGLMGSDHCPVYATISDIVDVDGKETHITDIMNAPGVFHDGKRLKDWTAKNLLPLSAKLIPEFDRRQSIKDMFFKTPARPNITAQEPQVEVDESATEPTTPMQKPASQTVEAVSPVFWPDVKPLVPSPSKNGTNKRTAPASVTTGRPQKKTKATLSREPSTKGQSSLMGFFKPKVSASPKKDESQEVSSTPCHEFGGTSHLDASLGKIDDAIRATQDTNVNDKLPGSPDRVFDPIENKESWSKLLGKRVVPKCEHGEDCISLQTKKPGVNKGRSFYICPRPIGPSGEKEYGTQWRCGTFIWSSDWTAPRPSS